MSQGQISQPPGRRVLVVDDNALMRTVLSSMLMHRGYEVLEVASAEAALDNLRQENFDLLILDVMLTGMSGIDLCQIIRNELELVDLPVVAFTAGHHVERVAHMRLAGFNDFLFKPVHSEALDTVLSSVMLMH